ncbi:MAG: hypothetical protein V7L30_32985, partial [Nostoc sp.]|uniref:hypothetical protein n=1 Tax=Nostoc sp. TaxID=1180 RepID=UPI002FFC0CDB
MYRDFLFVTVLMQESDVGKYTISAIALINRGVTNNGFVIPPSPIRTIGDALLEKRISWRYY